MIYPDSFEKKIGFAAIRDMVANHCTSSLGREYCSAMAFSTDFETIKRHLTSTSEMKTIISGDEAFPLENIHDVNEQLRQLRVPGTFITAPDLLRIRQSLATIAAIAIIKFFFFISKLQRPRFIIAMKQGLFFLL